MSSRLRTLVDPRLPAMLGDFYPSLLTVQDDTTVGAAGGQIAVRDSFGQVTSDEPGITGSSPFIDVTGMVDIPCMVAPVTATEQRTATSTLVNRTHRAALKGAWVIDAEQRVVVTTQLQDKDKTQVVETYNVLGVQTDSQGLNTYLDLEKVST